MTHGRTSRRRGVYAAVGASRHCAWTNASRGTCTHGTSIGVRVLEFQTSRTDMGMIRYEPASRILGGKSLILEQKAARRNALKTGALSVRVHEAAKGRHVKAKASGRKNRELKKAESKGCPALEANYPAGVNREHNEVATIGELFCFVGARANRAHLSFKR
jgi:hypothetical protein